MPDRVVVVGAGFGGLSVVRHLGGDDVDVTLVDRHNFHTFLPLLYQVATAGLNAADVAHAVRGIVRRHTNVTFRQATVTGVDWGDRTVRLTDVLGDHELPFDHIVVGAGATAAFFGIPGAEEHAIPLYTLEDATRLRNHVLGRFEVADADPALIDDGALTFVVVGAGPTGVEVSGALSELFAMVLRKDFRTLDISRARIVLVEMGDAVLPTFGEKSRADARKTLEGRGVEVRTGTTLREVTATRVHLARDDERDEVRAHTLVWAAGVQANALAAALDVETARGGRIVVGPDLRIPGHDGAFAIGDIAAIPDGEGGLLPGVAQVAIQGGRFVAEQIRRPSASTFRYKDKGTMATIGRRAAVAELPNGIRLSGTPGWLAWLGLHLLYLIGFRNRLSVLVNWGWNYLTWDRGPRIIFGERGRAAVK